jgi:hypothetical protein
VAEGGVSDIDLRWFVLPPGQGAELWRSAMLAHAQSKGAPIVEVVSGNEVVPADHIALSADLDIARMAGATDSNTTVLRLQPSIDLSGCGLADIPSRALDVTRKIAAAYSFEGLSVAPGERLPPPFDDMPTVATGMTAASPLESDYIEALAVLRQGSGSWPATIFRYASGLDVSDRVGVVDITGRPRFLFNGPYIFLTPGVWRATVRLGFDHDAGHKRYELQWGGGESYVDHKFLPGRSGVFEIALDHEWTVHAATEVRLMLLEGAFHGQVTLDSVTIERLR